MRISITTLMLITACAALTQATHPPRTHNTSGSRRKIFIFDPARNQEFERIRTPKPLPRDSITSQNPLHPLHRITDQLDSGQTHRLNLADFHLALLAYDAVTTKTYSDTRCPSLVKRVECSNALHDIRKTHKLPEHLPPACEVARLKIESLKAKDGNDLDEKKITKALISLWNGIFDPFREYRLDVEDVDSPLPGILIGDSWERDCTHKDIAKDVIVRAPAILYFSALIRHDHASESKQFDNSSIYARPLRCLRIALENYAPHAATERTLYDVELKAIKSIEDYTPRFPVDAPQQAKNRGATAIRKIAEVSYPKDGHNAGFYAFIGHLPTNTAFYYSLARTNPQASNTRWENHLKAYFAQPARK